MSETSPKRKHRGEKTLLITSALIVVLFTSIGLWINHINKNPTITVPNPAMPNPNAYDTYLQAANVEVGANAQGANTSPPNNAPPAPLAARLALVKANGPSLSLIKTAQTQESHAPLMRSMKSTFPQFAQFRELARMLKFVGDTRADTGDYNGAADAYVDAMRLGVDATRGGNLIASLVGIACEAIGGAGVYSTIDQLTAPQARHLVQRLETVSARRNTFSDTIQEEKNVGKATIQEMFQNSNNFSLAQQLASGFGFSGSGPNFFQILAAQLQLLRYSRQDIINNYTNYMDATIAQANTPYTPNRPTIPIPPDPINKMMTGFFSQAETKLRDREMQTKLLTVCAALHAYKLEQGTYPDTLDDLVTSGILKTVPTDPFTATNAPLMYRKNANGKYLLYSVGIDGRDNKGTHIDNPTSNGKQKRYLETGDQGDFVAGINLY